MQHTPECIERSLKEQERVRLWDALWPNYCKECEAQGVVSWTENGAPHGEGFWGMPMSDVCDCLALGHCPRCAADNGEDWNTDETEACPKCGWNNGTGADDYRPQFYECNCWCDDRDW